MNIFREFIDRINPFSVPPQTEKMDVEYEYRKFIKGWDKVNNPSNKLSLDDNPRAYVRTALRNFQSKTLPLAMTIEEMAFLGEIVGKYLELMKDTYAMDERLLNHDQRNVEGDES